MRGDRHRLAHPSVCSSTNFPATHMTYDFAIIGAGIVGLAAAREILRARPRSSIILLEKENAVAWHQTGHNSGVIHSGIYYAPGSLKARLCREGAAATMAFCAEQGIKYENCGKLLVATNERERVRMEALFERAKQNGIEACRSIAPGLCALNPTSLALALWRFLRRGSSITER